MATYENLNFDVLINDEDFDARCARIEKRAQELNTNLSSILQIDKVIGDTSTIDEMKKRIETLSSSNAALAKSLEEVSRKAAEMQKELERASSETAGKQNEQMDASKKMAAYYLDNAMAMEKENAARKVGNDLVKEAAEVSKQLKSDFAYLAEEEKKEADASKKMAADKVKSTADLKAQMQEYFSLSQKIFNLETSLAIKQVSNKKAQFSPSEANLLSSYQKKLSLIYAEMEKIMNKYPELWSMYNQTARIKFGEQEVLREQALAKEAARVTREKERANKAILAGTKATAKMTTEAKKLTVETGKVTKYVNQFKNILGGATSVYAIKRILSNLIEITGEFELQRTTLRAILQDATKADVIFEKIKGLALVSPFNFKELLADAKQLSAFSIPANELYETTKMLADLSAGLGVGMDRLILFYGQVRSASFLRGQEIRQATEAGIPLLEALRQEFERLGETGITTAQVFDKVSARLVPFEMVRKVLTDMTEEGGKFYNMQEVQSETLKGKLSNLKDAFQMMFNQIGESQTGFLKGTVDAIREMMTNWEQLGKDIIALIAAFGTYKVAVFGLTQVLSAAAKAQKVYAMASAAGVVTMSKANLAFGLLGSRLDKFVKSLGVMKLIGNPVAMITAGVVALGYAVYKCATYMSDYEKGLDKISKAHSQWQANLETEKIKLSQNIAKLKELDEGTEEYVKMRDRMLLTYDSYLTDADKEIIKNQGLAESYDILAAAIGNASREKFRLQAENDVNSQIEQRLKDLQDDIKTSLKNSSLNEYLSQVVMEIISGNLDLSKIPDTEIKQQLEEYFSKVIPVEGTLGKIITGDTDYRFAGGTRLEGIRKAYNKIVGDSEKFQAKINELLSFKEIAGDEAVVNLQAYQKKVQDYYRNKLFPGIEQLTKEQQEKLNAQPFWTSDTKNNEGGIAYAKSLKETYDSLNKSLSRSEMLNANTVKDYKEQLRTIREIDALFNGAILREEETKKAGSKGEDPYKEEIEALKREYDLLKKVQSAYEALSKAGFERYEIGKLFTDTLGTDFKGLDFERQVYDITTALRTMGEDGTKAALDIENSFRKIDIGDSSNKLIDLSNQMKKYGEEMRKWMGEDFNLTGKGIILDLSKVAAQFNTEIDRIKQKADGLRASYSKIAQDKDVEKALEGDPTAILSMINRYGQEVWTTYYHGGLDAISKLEKAEIASAKRVSQERINDLAKKYGREVVSGNPAIKTKDYADLSLGQLSKSIKTINELLTQSDGELAAMFSDDLVAKIREAGFSLDDFKKAYLAYLTSIGKDNQTEKFKKLVTVIKNTVGYVSQLSGAFRELGEASGNEGLVSATNAIEKMAEIADIVLDTFKDMSGAMKEIGDGMGGVSDGLSEAAEGGDKIASSADWITMIIKVVLVLATSLIDGFAQAEKTARAAKLAMEEFARSVKLDELQKLLDGDNSIFGTDGLANFIKDTKAAKMALADLTAAQKEFLTYLKGDSMYSLLDGLSDIEIIFGGIFRPLLSNTFISEQLKRGLLSELGLEDLRNVSIEALSAADTIRVLDKALYNLQIRVKDYGWFANIFVDDEYMKLGDFFPDLFNEDGSVNWDLADEALEAVEKTGAEISDELRKLLTDMAEYGKKYQEAMKQIHDYFTSIFGQLSSDVADVWLDMWDRMGQITADSAQDIESIVNDLGRQIMKSLIQNVVLAPLLDKYQKLVEDAYTKFAETGDERTFTETIGNIFSSLNDSLVFSADAANKIMEMGEQMGVYDRNITQQTENLKNSIQGITEETANRIANLLNGIYSEMFRQGSILDVLNANVAAILEKYSQSITENTYQVYVMQIAANTYDTAQSNRLILERIDNVIANTGGTGGQGVKVYLQ